MHAAPYCFMAESKTEKEEIMKGKQKKMNLKRVLIIGLTLCGIMPSVGAQEFNEGITGSKSTDEIYLVSMESLK